ncbi:hypothetical protein OIE66_23855 [Nonomuraea sp. NBC_01738]|uniref:hypothetical protein n=1 Tax=Nonomuraea sp. NBC_01738 TaxID=2976003 RepID=UPI002E137800|nr:hypothetical protein OIE66_23855 [Nonomuraea sp. NBC_01738]
MRARQQPLPVVGTGAHPDEPGGQPGLDIRPARLLGQRPGLVEQAAVLQRLGRERQPPRALLPPVAQLGRPTVRRRGGRVPVAPGGPYGRALQLSGQPLVGTRGDGGQVPDPAAVVLEPAERLGQRTMRGQPGGGEAAR